MAALVITLAVATNALAIEPGQVVDNFRLLDQQGQSHELHSLSDRKAVVLMIQSNGCLIVRQALPALAEVRAKYRAEGVEFLLLNSNLPDTRTTSASNSPSCSMNLSASAQRSAWCAPPKCSSSIPRGGN